MSINSSYLNPDSSGDPHGSSSSNGSADSYGTDTYGTDSYGAGTETGVYGAYGAASASDSYSSSGGYSSYDEPASPLSTTSAASAMGTSAGATSANTTSASSAAYNSTGAYSSTDAYESTGSSASTGSSNSTKDDAVWRGQSSKEPAELKRPRVSTLIASLIMLAAAAILGALAMGVHFSWTAVGASTLGTIGLVLIVSAFFASRNKSHS